MRTITSLLLCILFCGCEGKYSDSEIRVSTIPTDCIVIKDNSQKREEIYFKCRSEGSWDITCLSTARSIAPDVKECKGVKRVVQVWYHFPREFWSEEMDCSRVSDVQLINACNSR